MFVRAYLRASSHEQDATRARAQLEAFAAEHGLHIAATYVENEPGSKLARPELFRLLADARPGDILLVEQVDRLSRLTAAHWERLKSELAARHIRVVALDLPTSWVMEGERRRIHDADVRRPERHDARYARRGRSEGLRGSSPPAGSGTGQGESGGPV